MFYTFVYSHNTSHRILTGALNRLIFGGQIGFYFKKLFQQKIFKKQLTLTFKIGFLFLWKVIDTLLVVMKSSKTTVENSLVVPHKELLYEPAIPLLGIYPKITEYRDSNKYLYANVHNSIIHNSQR